MSRLHEHRGFTLLEVLVAITILSIGILGVAGLTIGIIRGNLTSKHVTNATVVAQDWLAEIRRVGYAGAATQAATDISMGGGTYSRTTTVTNPGTPIANTRTVSVQVTWDNNAHSVTLQTILAQ